MIETNDAKKLKIYENVYKDSIKNPERFFGYLAQYLTWTKHWKTVLNNKNEPFTRWFDGGEISACYNALDRHIENGNGDTIALIFDSPVTHTVRKITYHELYENVAKLANVIKKLGIDKGDTVIIYMPPIPETIMAMLACARIGAVHSVVFGGFAAGELGCRIEHARSKLVIASNCGVEPNKIVNYYQLLNDAISISRHKPEKCLIFQRKNVQATRLIFDRDVDWEQAMKTADLEPCVSIEANEPLYILYTSGTTGDPKGIVRPVGGHLVVLQYTMHTVYGMKPGDVWWATSDFGWAVGHSYMCYGPLLYGITSVIYEGKPTTTPDPSQWFRVINDYKVNGMFTVPTALKVLRHADPSGNYRKKYDLSSLRTIFVGGEFMDVRIRNWAENIFATLVSNNWWQTETGTAVGVTCTGLGLKNPPDNIAVGLPFPGHKVEILKEDGSKATAGEMGSIAIKLPLSPGSLSCLYKAPEKFLQTYFTKFPGYYDTTDVGYIDSQGWLYVTARSDDVIKVSGHRISALSIENIVLAHPDISDACVVGVPDEIKGDVPLCLYIRRKDCQSDNATIQSDLIKKVREVIGPVASFKLSVRVKALPHTITGKICRKAIAQIANNTLEKVPATIVDASVLDDIRGVLTELGFCK